MQKNEIERQVEREIADQPRALNELMRVYAIPDGRDLLQRTLIPQEGRVLFTGMGASFHAAMIGAELSRREGVDGTCAPASEVVEWHPSILSHYDRVIYISQSGASGEVAPLLEKLDPSRLIAMTNDPVSQLAKAAALTLPLCAGEEKWIASKTYLNSLALLRLVTGCWMDGPAAADRNLEGIKKIRQRLQVILEARKSLSNRCLDLLGDNNRLVILGNGLQSVSARQTALMLAEWAKLPTQACSLEEFRHGLIETVDDQTTVLIFRSSDRETPQESARIDQLHEIGVRMIKIVAGLPLEWGELQKPGAGVDRELSPLLDTVAAQILCLSLAFRNGQSGFRYIRKIVTG